MPLCWLLSQMKSCSICQPAQVPGMRTTVSRLPIWQHATRQWHVCYATTTSGASRRRKKQTTATSADIADDLENSSSTTQPRSANVAPTVAFGEPPDSTLLDQTQSWVVFSDLHVSAKTIDTSIEVLKYVHQQAKEKQAGVLFLGDFWDRRGDLPVVPLNRVQDEISSWEMPLLLLPGNHDQVDLGGLDHSLDPIKVAAPQAYVFTRPAIYRGSLWLPYRRRESEVRDAISQAQQQGQLKAIFGHADVLTAHMNASYQAKDGLPPDLFPSQVPVYLGHYHYPHTVEGTSITYVGSPYQVSSSEAGQQKRLLLLDHNWQMISEIPLNLGRRFWNFSTTIPAAAAAATSDSSSSSSGDESSSITDTEGTLALAAAAAGEVGGSSPVPSARFLLQPEIVRDMLDRGDLRSGDVAHVRINEETEESLQIQKMLAREGVQVQLHIHAKAKPVARIAAAEQLSMQQLLEQYAATTGMKTEVLDCARQVLKELGDRSSQIPQHSRLELDSVTVQGFGPFKGSVDYPLVDRGVVAVTGRNEDDAAAVSNGAGKTSLLTSLLWAFKVDDSRDMNAADYVNEDSKSATVTVRGSINKDPFVLIRSTTGGLKPKGSLTLTINGQDLTSQEQRLTQATLESKFSTSLLPKTMVFTQEKLLMLLQSNDATFKEQLSSVVDTKSWEEAKDIAKQYRSQHEAKRSELEILEKQCRQNIGRASDDLDRLQGLSKIWDQEQKQKQASALQTEQSALQQVHSTAHEMHLLHQQISAALAAAEPHQQSLQSAITAAHKAANSTAQQLTQQQQQQQQEEKVDDSVTLSGSSSSSSNLLDQQQNLQYDSAAAAAALQPLLIKEQQLDDLVTSQQSVVSELNGQSNAAKKRRSKFQKLQKHTHAAAAAAGTGSSASSSSSSKGNGVDSAAAAADGGSDGGAKWICEQCLQPINLELYQKNLDNMAADEQQIQQQIDEASHLLEQYKQEYGAAQQQRLMLQQQQENAKQQVLAARERVMSERAAAEAAARKAADAARRREQQQAQEQQRQQQQLFEQERKLQGQLTLLQQAMQKAKSLSAQLTSTLTYISNKLQLPDLINYSSGGSSSSNHSTEPPAAAAAGRVGLLDVMELLQPHGDAAQLCGVLTSAGDSVVEARGDFERRAREQNPHLSGVNQAQRALEEQQQRLQENEQQMGTVSKQVDLWKRVYVAFGRTGIPSFLTEDALNQLQLACSKHLTQLASGMSLELSATSVKSSNKKFTVKSTGKKAGTVAKKKAAKSAASSDVTAAAAAATLDETNSLDPALSALRSQDLDQDQDQDQDQISDLKDGGLIKAADLDADVAAADLKEEISKIVRVRSAGGELRQRSIAQLSGGEKKRVALALGLGFAELVAKRSRLTSNVLILDEVLEKLDDEGCACVAQVLKRLPYSSVFVVGQVNSFVTNEFATVDTVVKSGGCAIVELGVQQRAVAHAH